MDKLCYGRFAAHKRLMDRPFKAVSPHSFIEVDASNLSKLTQANVRKWCI